MIGWVVKQFYCYFLMIIISFVLAGCSILREPIISKQSISAYAELLFKRQNLLTQQVMLLEEQSISNLDDLKITQAEEQMHDACHLLNEYAIRETEGKQISLFFRRKVRRSFDDCEEEVNQLETLLNEILE